MADILTECLLLFRPQVNGSGFEQLNRKIKQTHDSMFSLKNLFGAFIGFDIYQGIKGFATGLVTASQELGAMTSRFYAITKSEQLANEELEWTFKLAERTAMSMKSTADSYSIFFSATQKGLGTSGARQVFQDWTEVSRVLHLSEYQFERVTYALREMASKGAIYSQDLRMQIGTHVPNAMGLAQKAVEDLGITGNNWFEVFQKKAKGNQKLINQFIVNFSKYAKQMYASPEALAKAMEKPDAQIQKLLNTWQKFKYELVESGFEKDLVSTLKILNSLLSKMTSHAKEIYKWTKIIVGLVVWLGSTLALGKIMMSCVAIVSTLVQMVAITQTLRTTLLAIALIIEQKIFGIPLLKFLLTNPFGWATLIIAGVALIAVCIYKHLDTIKKWWFNLSLNIMTFFNNLIAQFNNSPLGKWWQSKTHPEQTTSREQQITEKLKTMPMEMYSSPSKSGLAGLIDKFKGNNQQQPKIVQPNITISKIENNVTTQNNNPQDIQRAIAMGTEDSITKIKRAIFNGIGNSNINSKYNGAFGV